MGWSNLAKSYGLKAPYRFEVAIPLLLNACGTALVLLAGAYFWILGDISPRTDRFYFVLYLATLFGVGAAISGIRFVGGAVFVWGLIEVTLGISTNALSEHGVGISLLPSNGVKERQTEDLGLTYHPLLQAVPKKNWRGTNAYYWHGNTYNDSVIDRKDLDGRELEFFHNSLGLRGYEPTKSDLAKGLIFVYGGSTTYDMTVSQGETWVEQLQEDLGGQFTLLNFGMHAYGTTESLIQTAFYQSIDGKRPVCAIYYEGLNDIKNAHLENLDGAYADYHLLNQVSLLNVRRPAFWAAPYSPLIRLASDLLKNRFDSLPEAPTYSERLVAGGDPRLEEIYSEHIKTIAAINNARGIKTVFVGQILNRELLQKYGKAPNGWVQFVRNEDVWPLQVRFNQILRAVSEDSGVKYIDPGIENFRGSTDFSDTSHFSPNGSKKFARLIAPEVERYCHLR